MFRIAAASLSLLVVKAEMLESDQELEHQNHCTSILIADSSIYPGETEFKIFGCELKIYLCFRRWRERAQIQECSQSAESWR